MSETGADLDEAWVRCPECDSLTEAARAYCRMCGANLTAKPAEVTPPARLKMPQVDLSNVWIGRVLWGVAAISLLAAAWAFVTRPRQPNPTPSPVAAVSAPSHSSPTPYLSPTPIPQPTNPATAIPTETPTLLPTPTFQPPFAVTVAAGDTLFGLAFRFNVSVDSLAAENGLSADNPTLRQGQTLAVPYPTATPPLQPVEFQLGEEKLVAVPTECQRYEIQEADSLARIAGQFRVPLEGLLAVNRLTVDSIMQPGDTVCIPTIEVAIEEIDFAGAGTSASADFQPFAIQLLYPPNQTDVLQSEPITLQWVAFKNLSPDEYYMVEVTDLKAVDRFPNRDFTRQTSFQMPADWLTDNAAYRWRVYVVSITGKRADDGLNYRYNSLESGEAFFNLVDS